MRFLTLLLLSCSLAFSSAKTPIIVMETSAGDIEITLMPDVAPKAVENFVTHIKNGYYSDGVFHRIIKNFMIQGGDPKGNGFGGESIWGHGFAIEVRDDVTFDRAGLLAMARTSRPESQGSQFFITTKAATHLNGDYTIFGEVKPESMRVVYALESTPVVGGQHPVKKPRIIKMWVK